RGVLAEEQRPKVWRPLAKGFDRGVIRQRTTFQLEIERDRVDHIGPVREAAAASAVRVGQSPEAVARAFEPWRCEYGESHLLSALSIRPRQREPENRFLGNHGLVDHARTSTNAVQYDSHCAGVALSEKRTILS